MSSTQHDASKINNTTGDDMQQHDSAPETMRIDLINNAHAMSDDAARILDERDAVDDAEYDGTWDDAHETEARLQQLSAAFDALRERREVLQLRYERLRASSARAAVLREIRELDRRARAIETEADILSGN